MSRIAGMSSSTSHYTHIYKRIEAECPRPTTLLQRTIPRTALSCTLINVKNECFESSIRLFDKRYETAELFNLRGNLCMKFIAHSPMGFGLLCLKNSAFLWDTPAIVMGRPPINFRSGLVLFQSDSTKGFINI